MNFWSKVIAHEIRGTNFWDTLYIELELPQDLPPDSLHALEPWSNISLVHLATTSELWPLLALFLAWQ